MAALSWKGCPAHPGLNPAMPEGHPSLGYRKNTGPTARTKRPVASLGALHPSPTSVGQHAPSTAEYSPDAFHIHEAAPVGLGPVVLGAVP